MGTIKDRNSKDLIEAEEMKRINRTVLKKVLMTQITTVVWSLTQSQTFWAVKSSGPWEALLSAKLVEVMGFQQSYLRSQKMMPSKCYLSMSANLKTQQWPQDWKRSILTPVPKKGCPKQCSNHQAATLISHANKLVLRILHARLQQYVNLELPDVQAGFRKGRGTRVQIASIC